MSDLYDNPFKAFPIEFFYKYIAEPETKTQEEKDFLANVLKQAWIEASDRADEELGITAEYKAMMRKHTK